MKRNWICSVVLATFIFCGIDVCFGAANCPSMDQTVRSWGGSAEAKIPDDFVDNLNASIKALLPTLTCEIDKGASVVGAGTKQNCCDDGTVVSDGLKNADLTATLSGLISGTLAGGKYSKTYPVDMGWTTFNIKVGFDVGLSIGCAGSGTVSGGYTQDDCLDTAWGYGGLTLNLVPTCGPIISGEICIETASKTNGLSMSISPLDVSASFTGAVGYNTAESECGWYGSTVLNNVRCTTSMDIPFKEEPLSATYQFYPTPGHWLAEGEE